MRNSPNAYALPDLVKLLTSLTGGKVALGDDPVQVANDAEVHINAKKKSIGT